MPFEAQQILQILLPYHTQQDQLTWGPDKKGVFQLNQPITIFSPKFQCCRNKVQMRLMFQISGLSCGMLMLFLAMCTLFGGSSMTDCQPDLPCLRGVLYCLQSVLDAMALWRPLLIFLWCDWARMVWFASPLGIRFQEQINGGVAFKEWLADCINCSSAESLQLIFAICYGLWFARNKLCFEQLQILISQIINKALSSVEELKSLANVANQLSTTLVNLGHQPADSSSSWLPPPTSSFKLNVDAAGPINDTWGIGVIVRDFSGFVMAAERWKISCLNDAAVAEAVTLKLGLKFALDLLLLNVQAESDSITVVSTMNANSNINNYMGMVIQDCKSFENQFSTSCAHIGRNANQAAHGLAKSALSSDDSF